VSRTLESREWNVLRHILVGENFPECLLEGKSDKSSRGRPGSERQGNGPPGARSPFLEILIRKSQALVMRHSGLNSRIIHRAPEQSISSGSRVVIHAPVRSAVTTVRNLHPHSRPFVPGAQRGQVSRVMAYDTTSRGRGARLESARHVLNRPGERRKSSCRSSGNPWK